MSEKLKAAAAALIIIILLPYVLTMLLSGKGGQTDEKAGAEGETETIEITSGGQESEVELGAYLVSVLAGQVTDEWEEEAMKAQAVVDRTQVKKTIEDNPGEPVESEAVSLDKLKVSMGGARFADFYERLAQAVDDTAGEVLTYDGELIEAPFHAVSGGQTRSGKEAFGSGDYPYLASVDCEKDKEADGYLALTTFAPEELAEALAKNDSELEISGKDIFSQIEVKKTDAAGYVLTVAVGNKTLTGEDFRRRLGLNSSCLTIQNFQGDVRIATRGFGHGLGMSQYTARRMARAGKTYREILSYFYKDTEIGE